MFRGTHDLDSSYRRGECKGIGTNIARKVVDVDTCFSSFFMFSSQIRKPTPAAVHTYFKLTPGATYDEKVR